MNRGVACTLISGASSVVASTVTACALLMLPEAANKNGLYELGAHIFGPGLAGAAVSVSALYLCDYIEP